MRNLLRSWLVSFACVLTLPSAAAAGEVDFPGLAKQFFERHPIEGRTPAEIAFEELLERHYALAQLGAIDVRIPREFLDDKGVATSVNCG